MKKMLAFVLFITLIMVSACGSGNESSSEPQPSTVSQGSSFENLNGWWYMPEGYAEGIALFEIFRLDADAGEFTAYDEFANEIYTGSAYMDGEGIIWLDLDMLGEVELRPDGADELYDEIDKLAFVRGDELVARDAGVDGNWYLNGDTSKEYYTLNSDCTYTFEEENGAITEGEYRVSSVRTFVNQGEPFDQIHIKFGDVEAKLNIDGTVFLVYGADPYMHEDFIDTPQGEISLKRNELTCGAWKSDDRKAEISFFENGAFEFYTRDDQGNLSETSEAGSWELEDAEMLITWENGEVESAGLFTNPTSFYIPSINQGFAAEAGTSKRSNDEEIYKLGDKEFSSSVRELDLSSESIDDISVLANCTELESLDISYTRVSDISALAGLTNLKELILTRGEIADISPLRDLTQLEDIDMRGNYIEDYSVLENLTSLRSLGVDDADFEEILNYIDISGFTSIMASNCNISDLTPFVNCSQLESLMIDDNPFGNEELAALSGLTSLEKLWIGGTLVDDVSPLANLSNLKYLSLYGSDIKSAIGIEQLKSLKSLELNNSGITDISFVSQLTNLEYIGLSEGVEDVSVLLELANLKNVSANDDVDESFWPDYQALEDKGVSVSGMPFEFY